MDSRYTGQMLKHLEKQNEVLTDAHKAMAFELHKLQVEEEMMMRKFYEVMTAHGLNKKNKDSDEAISDIEECGNKSTVIDRPNTS